MLSLTFFPLMPAKIGGGKLADWWPVDVDWLAG
jgi:hypothetical protein